MTYVTREEWLMAAIPEIVQMIEAVELPGGSHPVVPQVRVSVGFPAGVRGNKAQHTIGQCWNASAVQDGRPAIFISPILDDRAKVLDVLAHELIHAAVPNAGHTGAFRTIALGIGLVGRMTATEAGPELRATFVDLAEYLGEYQHSKVDPGNRRKQGTRMLKAQCPECRIPWRGTRKALDNGLPICDAWHSPVRMVEVVSADGSAD